MSFFTLGKNALIAFAASLSCAMASFAEESLPKELQGVTVKEHLGDSIDTSLTFKDHNGQDVALKDYFSDGKPVLLTLNYYVCQTLCTLQLNALVDGLRGLNWTPGKEFRIVTISIDPRNTPELASEKRKAYLQSLGKGDVEWHFLVGNETNIAKIASQVGFEYKWDPVSEQYAHGLAIYFVTPEGKLSRYLYGLTYSARDLKFALLDSSSGKIGTSVENFILNCFHYDETQGRYGPSALKAMRYGGLFTVGLLGMGLAKLWRREKISVRSRNRVV